MELRFPKDLLSRPEMELLVSASGSEDQARSFWLGLWVTLAYLAPTAGRSGRLTQVGAASLRRKFRGEAADRVLDALVEAGWLVPETVAERPTETCWLCPLFEEANPQLAPDYEPGHKKGHRRSLMTRRLDNYLGTVDVGMAGIPEDRFRRPDGTAMTEQERREVLLLVRACDLLLEMPERSHDASGFSQSLCASAFHVVKSHTVEARAGILRLLDDHRRSGLLPPSTEELLRDFRQTVVRVQQQGRAT